ncbi:MAG: APC family permease [Candidatus Planktophila sp.]|nr:APC family permease [Candidatus Planktophila sp.]
MPEQSSMLRKGRLGVFGIVFFVVAASAPLVGMTGAVPVAMLLGNGAATPGAYLAAGITLLIFSIGYASMSHHVTNAGAFFAFVGKGLGLRAGVSAAYASLVGYLTIQLAIYGFFGLVMNLTMAEYGVNLNWYVWSLIGLVIATILSVLSVDVGAKILGALLIFEILSLLVTALAIFIKGGPESINIWGSFNPSTVFAGGFSGPAGIALAFAFASFIGFEATAIYGEESRNPKRDVPRATYYSIIAISAIFAVVSFAMVVGMGHSKLMDEIVSRSSIDGAPLADPANVLFSLSGQFVGSGIVDLMKILVVTSLFAGLLAFQNAASRYFFAMGRAGVMPKNFAKTNNWGAPQNASFMTSIIAAAVIVIFAAGNLDPFTKLFSWMSGIAVISIGAVEILVSLAVVKYFSTMNNQNIWKTKIAPIASVVLLGGGLYLLMARFNLLAGTVPSGIDPSLPESVWKLSSLGWFLILVPFIAMAFGYLVATISKSKHESLTQDFS